MNCQSTMRYCYWVPPIIWAILIFWASQMPITEAPPLFDFPGSDKVIHFGVYAVLSLLLFVAFSKGHQLELLSAGIFSLVISSVYGALDEWHQSFIPERSVELADWLADTAGAATLLLLITGIMLFKKHKARLS